MLCIKHPYGDQTQSGSVTVEWALALPPVLFLFACLLQLNWISEAREDLMVSAAAAARAASIHPENLCYAWAVAVARMAPDSSDSSSGAGTGSTLEAGTKTLSNSLLADTSKTATLSHWVRRGIAVSTALTLTMRPLPHSSLAGPIRSAEILTDGFASCNQRLAAGLWIIELTLRLPLRIPLTSALLADHTTGSPLVRTLLARTFFFVPDNAE